MKAFVKTKSIAFRASLFIIVLLLSSTTILAQQQSSQLPTTIEGWADRLARFGQAIPQEKVFVHMDNTSYFLGDTIWFAAYTRRTDKDAPSAVSGVLYVELLNQEGYLVERQLIEMRGGRGHGNFVLADTLYGGFYELRAYTRWQLNWGITEKEHTSYAEQWFYSKALAKDFYRDYEKLYSRVFPVYDKPEVEGQYFHDMTTRPLRRYFRSGTEEPEPTLTLFPEGGNLVAGVPCRVAFEAVTETGEWLDGKLTLRKGDEQLTMRNAHGEEITEASAMSRGRGLFEFTPEVGADYTCTFTTAEGRAVSTRLPRVEADGVALRIQPEGNSYTITFTSQGAAVQKLGFTIMHQGYVEFFEQTDKSPYTLTLNAGNFVPGVHQVTVFDAMGRVWADRLFFIGSSELTQPTLAVSGLKDDYEPCEKVNLEIQGVKDAALSVAVRDAGTSDYTFDTSNILTEMLLSSEIRGYVPDPAYFFEADDEEHSQALDLLMLTQGWRRFNWHDMATPGAFEFSQPAEAKTPIMRGEVLNYQTRILQEEVKDFDEVAKPYELEERIYRLSPGEERDFLKTLTDSMPPTDLAYEGAGLGEVYETIVAELYAKERHFPAGSYQMRAPIAMARFNANEPSLSNEVRVHAEFAQEGSESVIGDVETRQGQFNIPSPRFYGYCVFFLAASDTTKWKTPRHTWIQMDETENAEFYVRIAWPYPRFTQAYNYYQTAYRNAPNDAPQAAQTSLFNPKTFETQMGGLTVRARRGGLRSFDPSHPALVIDAYEAFNEACDAGLSTGWYGGRTHFINSVARAYIGDMNTEHAYLLEPRYDGLNISYNRTPHQMNRYNQLTNLDSVRIYTDFHPRYGADPRATEDNVDRVSVDLRQLPDEGQRVTYRDRRYILQGFSEPEEFYNPDYSRHPLPDGQKDYRRTLYWNPNLHLDASGRATVSFCTGSQPTTVAVTANGQAADGKLLTN